MALVSLINWEIPQWLLKAFIVSPLQNTESLALTIHVRTDP